MLETAVVHTDNTIDYPITLYFGNIFSNGENYIVFSESGIFVPKFGSEQSELTMEHVKKSTKKLKTNLLINQVDTLS